MPVFFQLLKREAIEHRNGMILTPLIVAALIALTMLFGSITGSQMIDIELSPSDRAEIMEELQEELDEENVQVETALGIGLFTLSVPLLGISLIVSLFMLLGSLYDERSERSILFWKSMPVSDTATVLSKLVTGALLIPFAAAIVSFGVQLFALLVGSIFGSVNNLPIGFGVWTMAPIFKVWWTITMLIFFGGLWAAPFLSWLLLASSWAPRTPFLVAFVPIAAVSLLEALFNKTSWFITSVADRFSGAGLLERLGERLEAFEEYGERGLDGSDLFISFGDIGAILAMPGLWIGLIIAAGFTAGAIHIRRTKTL